MIAPDKNWLDIVQIAAICATLGVLMWYTIETYRLRKETQKQTENSTRPCIVCTFREGSDLSFGNVGTGPALNIHVTGKAKNGTKIEPIFIEFMNCGQLYEPIIKFDEEVENYLLGTTFEFLYMSLGGSRYYSKIGITLGRSMPHNPESFLLEYRQINMKKEFREVICLFG